MKAKQRILIISYFFYPYADVGAKRVSELALFLRKQGHDVTVITSNRKEGHIHPQFVDEIKEIDVLKTWDPPSAIDLAWKKIKSFIKRKKHRTILMDNSAAEFGQPVSNRKNEKIFFLKRYFFSYHALFGNKKLWGLSSTLRALTCSFDQPFDVVISSSPYTIAHAGALALKLVHKTPWLMDLRDPFSQAEIIDSKSQSALRTLLESRFEQALIKYCDKIVCASPGIARQLALNDKAKTKLHTILNGYDGFLPEAPAQRTKGAVLKLLYAGQLYLNRNPFPLIDAIKNLIQRREVDDNKITLNFYGQCEEWQGINLIDVIKKDNLEKVIFINGQISSDELKSEIEKSDVLINFAQGQKNQIPAKSFEYMQSGRYSFVFTEPDSDTAMLIESSETGLILDESYLPGIENAVKSLYEKKMNNEDLFVFSPDKIKQFARDIQNKRYYDLIAGAMDHG